jgi:hypothetical protein
MSMKTLYTAFGVVVVFGIATASERVATVQEILATTVCREQPVRVVAYLNSSRHGAWLSAAVGSAKGIALDFDENSSDPAIVAMRRYIYRPQEYTTQTFRAVFSGVLKCAADGRRPSALRVDKVEEKQISRIYGAKR